MPVLPAIAAAAEGYDHLADGHRLTFHQLVDQDEPQAVTPERRNRRPGATRIGRPGLGFNGDCDRVGGALHSIEIHASNTSLRV